MLDVELMPNKQLIGLLGGTSWPSTISYYEELNRKINYPRILLYSIDYGTIKPLYGKPNNWNKIAEMLKAEIEIIVSKGVDSLIICNNTLHKAFDIIENELNLKIPVHHAGKLSAKKAREIGAKKVLLLATKFTMQDGFFAKYFNDLGIEVILPSLSEMDEIQKMQTQIANGKILPEFSEKFEEIIKNNKSDAVCLACAELPLAVKNSPVPIINPMVEQIGSL
jgi:aspartate racemase